MMTHMRIKTALLAAVSLTAASIAAAPANAAALAEPAAPVEPAAIELVLAPTHHDEERAGPVIGAKRLGFAAAALAAFAGLARIIGFKRLKTAAISGARIAGKTAAAGARASMTAVKAAARAASSPLRFFLALAGLGVFALAGVGFYDVEWLGGLFVGALMAILVAHGAARTKKALAPIRRRRGVND
ncbi:MAG: hypothetical protein KDD85_03160 [Parvularculaceae bacterium]|nr:hypothetical protein [Parvularculaceae bacterium]